MSNHATLFIICGIVLIIAVVALIKIMKADDPKMKAIQKRMKK